MGGGGRTYVMKGSQILFSPLVNPTSTVATKLQNGSKGGHGPDAPNV